MPGGDGTGPLGNGANTGWGRGPCRGFQRPRFGAGGASGRGGRGGGRGWRNRFWATGTPGWMLRAPTRTADAGMKSPVETELEWLEQRSASLQAEQQQVAARLAELERERAD